MLCNWECRPDSEANTAAHFAVVIALRLLVRIILILSPLWKRVWPHLHTSSVRFKSGALFWSRQIIFCIAIRFFKEGL